MKKDNIWRCGKCEKGLAEIADDSNVVILGDDGRRFRVNFINIDVVCGKCGTDNHLDNKTVNFLVDNLKKESESEIDLHWVKDTNLTSRKDSQLEFWSEYLVSKAEKEKLFKVLSVKAKEIFDLLQPEAGLDIVELSHRVGMSEKTVRIHLDKILDKVKNIKTNS